jgi:hypothetical protein
VTSDVSATATATATAAPTAPTAPTAAWRDVTIDEIVGSGPPLPRVLDAVGEVGANNARCFYVRLDGVVHAFVEDANDGYRSALDHARVLVNLSALVVPLVLAPVYPPMVVRAMIRPPSDRHNILVLINEATGSVVLEIGTEYIDDYYPGFISSWTPEGVVPAWLSELEESARGSS